ncbi:MAG: hypothetical protein J6J43_09235 [Oscillospiraceae bacterium]|nr:hypothetical protein [Oscillospiraceae bacterium]
MPSKYHRLTVPTPDGYEADANMAIERLGRLEDAIDRLHKEYEQTLDALQRLEGKEKTATYRQLMANKLSIQELMLRLGL